MRTALLILAALAACAAPEPTAPARALVPPAPEGVDRIEVVATGGAYFVDMLGAGATRTLLVWADGARALGPGDGETAASVAERAGGILGCGQQDLAVRPETARFAPPPAVIGQVAEGLEVWQVEGDCGG